ncbi:MAG: SAM-dependent chlorinase/fluorinase [Pseudomonadota bacterium]
MRHVRLIAAIAATVLAANATAGHHEKPEHNALIIQADFEGMVMAGVAKSVSKTLEVFNVRPLIPLYDIRAASETLAYNAQTWPKGTVFVSVVDPGVGTERKSVVLETKNGLYFVSPDNGTLSGVADAYGISAVREIDETVNRRPNTEWAHTFHGRDVYSYTGARLAAGAISFEQVGPLLAPEVIRLEISAGTYEAFAFEGQVAGGVDRLGNIYFNIDRALFEKDEPDYGDIYEIAITKDKRIVWEGAMPYAKSFGAVPVGENLLFINSSGLLSIAINQGNFADEYGIGYGADWRISIRKRR